MFKFRNLIKFNSKRLSFIIIAILITVIISISVPASAWTSNWILCEYPQPVTYTKNSGNSANTDDAWDASVTDWNNAQSKVDLDLAVGVADIHLSHADDDGVGWDGISYPYDWNEDDYLDYVLSQLNEHYTEGYSPDNKRRSVSGHELGHAIGLGESNNSNTLMEQKTNIRWHTYGICTPQQDDINGINVLYSEW